MGHDVTGRGRYCSDVPTLCLHLPLRPSNPCWLKEALARAPAQPPPTRPALGPAVKTQWQRFNWYRYVFIRCHPGMQSGLVQTWMATQYLKSLFDRMRMPLNFRLKWNWVWLRVFLGNSINNFELISSVSAAIAPALQIAGHGGLA